MSGRETYDVTATQRKILEARAARRTTLRHEYLKQIGNPYRQATGEGGSVFDEGHQRFLSMRATAIEFFRPTPKNGAFFVGVLIAPIVLVSYIVFSSRDTLEERYRTGQISYRDREFKFT